MELKDIKAIIDLMRKNDLSVFEMEKDGFRLKLQKGVGDQPTITTPIVVSSAGAMAAPGVVTTAAETAAAERAADAAALKDIVAPMVGTFYRAASPDAPPFIDVGKTVSEDSVVCIIEAMKVMNEGKAGMSGTIAEILIDNANPVEFGTKLFRVV